MAEALSLKQLQSHVIKTIVGSVITSLLVALITGFSFYFKTNAAIDKLNDNQTEMKKTIEAHTEQINKTNTGMGMSEVQQEAFEKRLTNIEEGQKEIMKLLIELKNNK
jgi:predicted PurR-regulated permease PerM